MELVKLEKPFFFLHLFSKKTVFFLWSWRYFLLRNLIELWFKIASLEELNLFGALPNRFIVF